MTERYRLAARRPASTATQAPTNLVNANDYLALSEGTRGYYFVTPSGKWRCAIVSFASTPPAMAGCQPGDNTQPSIGVPGAPASVPSPIGSTAAPNAIQIKQGQDPQFAYRGQADFWRIPTEATKVLDYGSTLDAGGFQCNVQQAGVSCKDNSTGKGFTFSDQGYEWTYTPVGGTADLGGQSSNGSPNTSTQFGGQWVGHGRELGLNPDGSATVRLASGAANGTTWNATWTPVGSGLTVTFGEVIKRYGDGATTIAPGTVWTGAMTTAEGANVLEFTALPDVYWCRDEDTGTGACGA